MPAGPLRRPAGRFFPQQLQTALFEKIDSGLQSFILIGGFPLNPSNPEHRPYKAQHSRPRKKQSRALKIAGILLLVVVLLIGIAAAGFYFYLDNQITEGDAGTLTSDVVSTEPELTGKVAHYLVCGIDYDDDRDYGDISKAKTDVILYVSLDIAGGEVNVLQIPRDSYVGDTVPTGGTYKLNNVYSHGEDSENPISNLAKVINDQYGLPVDHYLTIDMASFRYLLNLIGGIDMYIPYEITLKDKATGKEELLIEPGYQHINGDTAELILRNRNFSLADYQRLETQQYFYLALYSAFRAYPQDFIKVIPSFIQYFNTDMSVTDLLMLANTAVKIDSSSIGIVRAPGGPITRDGQSCYGINPENMAELLNKYFRPYSDPMSAEELGMPKLTDADFALGQNYEDLHSIGSLDPAATADADSGSTVSDSAVSDSAA